MIYRKKSILPPFIFVLLIMQQGRAADDSTKRNWMTQAWNTWSRFKREHPRAAQAAKIGLVGASAVAALKVTQKVAPQAATTVEKSAGLAVGLWGIYNSIELAGARQKTGHEEGMEQGFVICTKYLMHNKAGKRDRVHGACIPVYECDVMLREKWDYARLRHEHERVVRDKEMAKRFYTITMEGLRSLNASSEKNH